MHKIIYIFFSILIILYIILVLYIKLSHPFWFKQPVYHLYAFYNNFRNGVIQKGLPAINKYCNHINVITDQYTTTEDDIINKIVAHPYDSIEAVLNSTPAIQSSLLPKLHFYKVYLKIGNYQ